MLSEKAELRLKNELLFLEQRDLYMRVKEKIIGPLVKRIEMEEEHLPL